MLSHLSVPDGYHTSAHGTARDAERFVIRLELIELDNLLNSRHLIQDFSTRQTISEHGGLEVQ